VVLPFDPKIMVDLVNVMSHGAYATM